MLAGCVCEKPHGDASTKQTKLEMKLTAFDLAQRKFRPNVGTEVYAEIRNVGETPVLLPTKEIGPTIDVMGGVQIIEFTSDWFLSTSDGFKMPKAKSDLAIVELRPREAIALYCTLENTNTPFNPASVGALYRISQEFAERYGTWHGEIAGKWVQPK
jgi:hypothetical protein